MKILSKQNVIDILHGCTVLGTGGGGSLQDGLKMMEEDFAAGRELRMVDVKEIPDDAYIATPYGCGAPPVEGAEENPKYAHLPREKGSSCLAALKGLEKFMGVDFYAVSSTELGGANTAEALHIACQLGIPVADADPVGRSVPELQHSTYYVNDVSIAPMGVATDFGDVVVLQKVVDDFRAEDLVRAMAVASDNSVGVADHPTTGKIYRESVITGALSYAMRIGEILRESLEKNESVPHNIIKEMSGKLLFNGRITSTPWECVDGFNFGEIFIDGAGEFEGDTYKIWYKNENLISWKNGEYDVTCPDLICMFDDTGMPVTNPNAKAGMPVTVIALPADDIWKTEKGLDCFGPKTFGFDVEYTPFTV